MTNFVSNFGNDQFPSVTVQGQLDSINSSLADMATDVKNFGAKGDGVTDDTTAIQNAINSLTNGGTVLFPKGFTFLTNTLTISGNNIALFLDHSTVITAGITITGANSGIIGHKGTVQGTLKVAQLTADAPSGSTTLTFGNGHPFQVGDGIQSSYGLGGDGSNPISVTAITSTTVTVATATTATIPMGAYIGTYGWTGTVQLNGDGSYIKGLVHNGISITNARGYALISKGTNITTYGENLYIYNNGLDTIQVVNSTQLKMFHCKVGFIYDIAKQGIVLGDGSANTQSAKIYLDNCTMNRQNSDPEFFMNGVQNGSRIQARYCTFIGTNGVHPTGAGNWNNNSWTVVDSNMSAGSSFDKVEFLNCSFQDYEQGIISETSGNTTSQTYNEIEIKYCKGYNVVLGRFTHTTWNRFDLENCLFDGQNVKTTASWWLTNGNSIINFINLKILNDGTTKNFVNCTIKECTFDHANVNFNENTIAERITAIQSNISTYLSSDNASITRLKDLTIQNSGMTTASNLDSIAYVLPAGTGIVNFKFLNGTLGGFIYNNNYHSYYVLDIKIPASTFYGAKTKVALHGDDWNIPVNSKIENILDTSANRIKYVTKSMITTLSATAASGATSITLTSVTNVAVNDYINIALDNGRVWSAIVTAISGNTLTINNALPSQASSGNNVCDFLY